MRRHHRGLRALDQQAAQVDVAALGLQGKGPLHPCWAAQAGLAAAGILARRQADPGPELRAVAELLEVAHRGHHGRGRHRADAHQRGGLLHSGILFGVPGDALIAPGDVLIESPD